MSRARRDLLTRLGEYGGACPVDQLARSCGQHPNTVREHLEALVESGHVQRAPAPQPAGRGRPARLYQVAEQATAPAAAATLASVLAAEPRLLILDEPTTLLDRVSVRRLMRLLDGLSQSAYMATHDLEIAAAFPRVLTLESGRIVDDGRGDDVVARYIRRADEQAAALEERGL